ncbi:MAG: hypothetical protein CM15mP12_4890 [Gammaproteobacteria bacterium]|nr:MAG: hypothetical protein CM15mP12_4890 [Gammaproteobacteria bacterium]
MDDSSIEHPLLNGAIANAQKRSKEETSKSESKF